HALPWFQTRSDLDPVASLAAQGDIDSLELVAVAVDKDKGLASVSLNSRGRHLQCGSGLTFQLDLHKLSRLEQTVWIGHGGSEGDGPGALVHQVAGVKDSGPAIARAEMVAGCRGVL